MVLGLELMKYWRGRMGHYFQLYIKDAGNQALSVEPGAESICDELPQHGLAPDSQMLIRLGLG
jgi:hypothetical protein